jgi:hypothetical protein
MDTEIIAVTDNDLHLGDFGIPETIALLTATAEKYRALDTDNTVEAGAALAIAQTAERLINEIATQAGEWRKLADELARGGV